MTFEHIRLEQSPAAVATITIARPDRLNALSGQTVDELRAAVEETGRSGARCLLLTGEGRGFSSGADLASAGGPPRAAGAAAPSQCSRAAAPPRAACGSPGGGAASPPAPTWCRPAAFPKMRGLRSKCISTRSL